MDELLCVAAAAAVVEVVLVHDAARAISIVNSETLQIVESLSFELDG